MTQLSHKLNNEELGSNENPHPITPNKTKHRTAGHYYIFKGKVRCWGNGIWVPDKSKNKNKDKRKPCENACTELLFAGIVMMLCEGIDITNITLNCMINYVKDINEENVPGYYYVNPSILDCDDVDEYLQDLENNKNNNDKKKKCMEFLENLKKEIFTNSHCPIKSYVHRQIIEKIIVAGKRTKNKEIIALNKGLKIKEKKADVYLKIKEPPYWVGFSIKQSEGCTKSNYSINSLVNETESTELNIKKKSFLADNNIPKITSETTDEEKKQISKLGNILLHNRYNCLWNVYRECICKNNITIARQIIHLLFSSKVHYPMYEFDGTKVRDYTQYTNQSILDSDSDITFSEEPLYYLTKKGKPRKTAKMFYKLSFKNENYRVEFRFKNRTKYTTNPQFFCHKI